jgi:2-polyprenyl-3-methyl-5-hydroxy-6-metoxy-1,4-benzoquinol methylase
LSHRRLQAELMDQPGLDRAEHDRALDALGRANAVSRTAAVVWHAVEHLARSKTDGALRILDVACGGGHVAASLATRAARDGLDVEVVACDISPVALDYARTVAARHGVPRVQFERLDALGASLPTGFDVVLSTLFLHHLTDDTAVGLLARMAAAARSAVVVSDLRRSALGYCYTAVGCRVLSRSRVFRVDGLRSVVAAFTPWEAARLAGRAGLAGARVTRHWPQRWLLTWEPPISR